MENHRAESKAMSNQRDNQSARVVVDAHDENDEFGASKMKGRPRKASAAKSKYNIGLKKNTISKIRSYNQQISNYDSERRSVQQNQDSNALRSLEKSSSSSVVAAGPGHVQVGDLTED